MTILTPDEVSQVYSERIFDLTGATPRKRKIVCPLPMHTHHNYTPSFSVFWAGDRWRWQCHGNCNRRGDVIDLIGFLKVNGYDPRDKDKLSEAITLLTGQSFEPSAPKPPKSIKPDINPYEWEKYYPPGPQVVEYGKERGIDHSVMEKFKIGQITGRQINRRIDGSIWMTIPTFEEGLLRGIKLRNTNSNGLRYQAIKGSRSGLFNYDDVYLTSDRVYVVKGEIAAMVLIGRGLLACAPTGGESMILTDRYLQALAFADVVVIGDNDPDPEVRAKTRRQAEARAELLNAQLFYPPDEYKDIDEWILDKPEAMDILKGV
jgi:hypothetical protein